MSLVKEAEELKMQEKKLKTLAENPFQPAPELVSVDSTVKEEKTNKEVSPNQIAIKFTGNAKLAACGASFVKYWIEYEEGRILKNNFPCNVSEKTFKHNFKSDNLA